MADHNTTYKRKVPLNLPEPPRKKGKLAFEECALCCTEVLISHFAERPHASATNECRTCFKCWGKHFRHQLTVKDWDELSCLQCGTILTLEEYDEISSGIKDKDEISTTFQRKATESYLRQDLGDGECFVTCPSSTCKGGAIMADGHIFTCPDCKARYCFDCEAPMHENMSCEEFLEMPKKRNKEKAEEEILAAATLKKHSKECPKCKARLQKISGCDHFTCTMCNHEFCWLCFAPYRGADAVSTIRAGQWSHLVYQYNELVHRRHEFFCPGNRFLPGPVPVPGQPFDPGQLLVPGQLFVSGGTDLRVRV
ncbi:putative E3 ubiquitin-protein ligase [Cercospora beticola]|uniref:RBR-type E3 ubiquitin transferase n=1 Tax=Cercospora beticola TaxID=122368 RepID=A0A2G5HAD4_CERBT|nr:putative E3 ubiquitin-protein ligase [Cercospora beticola]PIA89253.1 putative E3 ubiquitin-protein ligase [Cercospora beticola]